METVHLSGKCSGNNRKTAENKKRKKLSRKDTVLKLYKTITHRFPNLPDKIREIEGFRKKRSMSWRN